MPVITEIEDLKKIYERRVPRMFYDYAETGSYTGQTFRENCTDFQKLHLRQKVAVDISQRSLATSMIGQDVSMPVAIAPIGLLGMQSADGEIKAARAAQKAGIPFMLSTLSICSIEDVAENTNAPFWFQVYTLKDTDFMRRLMDRAKAANCSAIVITVDLPMMGQRHKDIKNGLSAPPKLTLKTMANLATVTPSPRRPSPQVRYQFTWNNYPDDFLSKLQTAFDDTNVDFMLFQEEIGEEGTPHIQGFLILKVKKRKTYVIKLLPGCHITGVGGTPLT